MRDFAESLNTKEFKDLVPVLNTDGFRYLSTKGHSFLRIISKAVGKCLQGEEKMSHENNENNENLDNPRYRIDKQGNSILNSEESHEISTNGKKQKGIKYIYLFESFWGSQNKFSLNTESSLIDSHEATIFCLKHTEKAIKEFKKDRRYVSQKFADSYDSFLKRLQNSLAELKQQLIVGCLCV